MKSFLRRFLRLRWHSQNLNDRPDGTCGPMWRHGRAWFYPFSQTEQEAERNYLPGPSIGVSWTIPTHFLHAYIERGGGDGEDIEFAFACGLFALWIHVENLIPKRFHRWWNPYSERQFGLQIHHGAIWWRLWTNQNEWSSKTPKWREGNFNPVDFLLGGEKHTQKSLSVTDTVIPMPEGNYPATIEMYCSYWKRPRSPFVKRLIRANVEMQKPIPIPGKGENSWDCDDDAIYSLTTPAKNVSEATAAMVSSALRDRERYGGAEWEAKATR